MKFNPGMTSQKGLFSVALLLAVTSLTFAQDLQEAKTLFRRGQFDEVLQLADEAFESDSTPSEPWFLLKTKSLLAIGKFDEARETVEEALQEFKYSILTREIAAEVFRYCDDNPRATEVQSEIGKLWQRSSWRYQDVDDLVTVGRFLLSDGTDPKVVLDQLYKRAAEKFPEDPLVEIAIGDLALSKNDYQLAAKHFLRAVKLDAEDPRSHFGVAQAFQPSSPKVASESLNRVLEFNPEHIGAHLMLIQQRIAEESYDEAQQLIEKVLDVNPHQPEAWAYKAVLAHLESDYTEEGRCRSKALQHWKSNPHVDHLIGLQLSRKYRFEESVAYQRRSLVIDRSYVPAKIQLAHDLLRLGQELEGWKLAEEVFDADQYNVVANNLVTLRDNLSKFVTLEEDGFVVRMAKNEADIYGRQVMELLVDAEKKLASKYQVTIQKPVFVEIFPRQQDFAIRTFSLPGGIGFLGVCFGRVITMNSPAAQGKSQTNWKSVLWHEFCHVVTLQKTKNKMPRWLSEGISVHEEGLADQAWADRMSPEYREMILGDSLKPISELSSAFLKAETASDLQFAYFESSLAVRFIVEKFGEKSLVNVLAALGQGMPINDAISRHVGQIDLLDKRFEEYVKALAKSYGKNFDWNKPESPFTDIAGWQKWLADNENSFYGMLGLASVQLKQSPKAALETVKSFEELLSEEYRQLDAELLKAAAFRKLQQEENETLALESVLKLNASDLDACLRLLQIYSQNDDRENVKRMARLLQAINPLLKTSHRSLAAIAEKENDDELVVESLAALSTMDVLDRADTHYRLAAAQFRLKDSTAAKRNVLLALEAAPRFRDAHQLLLKIVRSSAKQTGVPGPLVPDAPKLSADQIKLPEGESSLFDDQENKQ